MGVDPVSWLAIAGAVASVAGAGTSAYTADKAADATKDAAKDQKAESQALRADLEEQEKRAEASDAAGTARRRQRALALGGGQTSTQLTGPSGLSAVGSYPRRSVIGG